MKNNLPLYFEKLKTNQEGRQLTLQEILSQFKQSIPANFIQIELQEGNYCGSTNPKWKDKPLSEKYGFTYQGEWIQIDIPHTLMEKLELEKGQDIIQPFYLDPQVLARKGNATYGGITVENESEIVLVNPNKIVVKEQGVQTELDNEKFTNWESQSKDILGLSNRITELEQEKENNQQTIANLQNQISDLERGKTQLENNFSNDKAEWEKQKTQLEEIFRYILTLWLEDNNEKYKLIEDRSYWGTIDIKKGGLNFTDFPAEELDLGFLTNLEWLEINNSQKLKELKLPNKLQVLKISDCKELRRLRLTTIDIKNLDILRCPNLEELKLLINEFFVISIIDCPNLKELKLNGGNDLRVMLEGFLGILDITQVKSLQSLDFREALPVKLKCKVIFAKSQRQKDICMIMYLKKNNFNYLYDQRVSLEFLISKGILTNYEEKD